MGLIALPGKFGIYDQPPLNDPRVVIDPNSPFTGKLEFAVLPTKPSIVVAQRNTASDILGFASVISQQLTVEQSSRMLKGTIMSQLVRVSGSPTVDNSNYLAIINVGGTWFSNVESLIVSSNGTFGDKKVYLIHNSNSFTETGTIPPTGSSLTNTIIYDASTASPSATLYNATGVEATFTAAGTFPWDAGNRRRIYAGASELGIYAMFLYAWSRHLSVEEIRAIQKNPWQIYKYDKKILYFDVGGGAGTVTGTLAATEGSDTAALTGDVHVRGALSVSESGADTAALSGDVLVEGALAATEGSDTAALTGDVLVEGALDATEGSDTAAFLGSGATPAITGTLAATEGADTAAITGKVYVSGTLSAVEGGLDGFAVSGDILVKGTLAASETGDDTAAFLQEILTLTPADLDAIAAAVWADPVAVAAHAKLDEIITRITC